MDISIYKGVLNSSELECYEFLVGGAGVNSFDEFQDILLSSFVIISVGEDTEFMDRYSVSEYCTLLNGMMIKYLSFIDGVVYCFQLLRDCVYELKLNDFTYGVNFVRYRKDGVQGEELSSTIRNAKIVNMDRFLGLMDLELGSGVKLTNVNLDDVNLFSFSTEHLYFNDGFLNNYRDIYTVDLFGDKKSGNTWDMFKSDVSRRCKTYKLDRFYKGNGKRGLVYNNFGLVSVDNNPGDEFPF